MQKQPTPVNRGRTVEKLAIQLGGRAYADKVSVRRGARQLFAAQRLLVILDVSVAVAPGISPRRWNECLPVTGS